MAPPAWWIGGGEATALRRDGFAPIAIPEEILEHNDLTAMLGAILAATGWSGTSEHLAEALPHMAGAPDITGLRNTLANLGYRTRHDSAPGATLRPDELPVVLLPRRKPAVLLFIDAAGQARRYVAGQAQPDVIDRLDTGGAGLLRIMRAEPPRTRTAREGFTLTLLRRFRPALPALLLASLMLALLALAVPFFTQAMFDMLIAGRTAQPMPMLLSGLAAALAFEAMFRALRMRILARIGARIDSLMSCATLEQLLGLPLSLTERVGISAQVARVRDFSTVREFFTGSLAMAALDAPFALLLVLVLALVGGAVALAPLAAAVAFGLLFLLVRVRMRKGVAALAVAAQERDQITAEILAAMRLLRATGSTGVWASRHAAVSAEAVLASARITVLGTAVAAIGQAITGLAALAAIAIGVHAVLAGQMSAGALIATMMVIWRVLGPLQMVFTLLSRWEQVRTSMRQADQMMAIAPEREPGSRVRPAGTIRGDVVLSRVSLRYLPQAEPALLGVSLEVKAGQMIAVTGASGSGKTTLLLTIMGLHRPTAGTVRIDGFDIRRFDPVELRRAVAYAPAMPQLLYGTIAQNLLLANRAATRAELLAAARLTGLDRMVGRLPDGFETRVKDNAAATLPDSLLARLSLTRALLRPAPIVLLDEPASGLDDEGSAALLRAIDRLRGRATLFVVTHRPSHTAMADRVLRLQDGELSELPRRPPPAAVPILPAAAAAARS
jgi:ATP-binding cassette subfamily C protein/ATP-binding cassette subfamily C protein LapB